MTLNRLPSELALLIGLGAAAYAAEPAGSQPVAIVASLSGGVSVTPRGAHPRDLQLFDWIVAGSSLRTGPDGDTTVVFASGRRYRLGAGASGTVGSDKLLDASGPVQELSPLPPLPSSVPLVASNPIGRRVAAIRIRGGLGGLYPSREATTLADETALRFEPLPETASYKIEVKDADGARVYAAEVESAPVRVPPGVLRPGASYTWSVRAVNAMGRSAEAQAEFVTLDCETAQTRATLRSKCEVDGDVDSQPLLAEIDRTLGLLSEAREAFRAALARSPQDRTLQSALERVEAQMGLSPTSNPR